MRIQHRIATVSLVLLFTFSVTAAQPNSEAPAELNHWDKMIGKWRTTEEGLKPDGSGWQPSNGADWHFYYTLNGWAVQDEYYSPPLDTAVEDPNKRQMGTNIRIFDPETKQWIMAWATKAGKRVDIYSATSTDKKIVMLGRPGDTGKFRRITFFDMRGDSFEWTLEFSDDGKTSWMTVYKIHGKRME